MVFSPLQLATIDVATRAGQRVLARSRSGKHINPQYSPDGKSLFFISDQDGFSDIYRLELASGAVSRVTRLSTGVSGITAISPALTVAPSTGRMLFSVFQDQGYAVYALDSARTRGEPLVARRRGRQRGRAAAGRHARPRDGDQLPARSDHGPRRPARTSPIAPYRSTFSLDAVGQPTVGVTAGGPFGTGVAGGVSFLFGDQLSDRQIGVGIQANGTVQDIGAQLIYQNLKHRWNYGASVQHVPVSHRLSQLRGRSGTGSTSRTSILQRIFIDEAGFTTAYPFSSTKRIEFSLSATRLGFSTQIQQMIIDGSGYVYDQRVVDTTSRAPIYYGQASVALVGDASYSAFTGPIQGSRYRFEVTPTVGTLSFTTALADYRKYLLPAADHLRLPRAALRPLRPERGRLDRPVSALPRRGAADARLQRRLVRPGRVRRAERRIAHAAPAFDRLLGSKLAVASFEIRIPVFGVPEYGLFNVPFLPLTLAPFVDAGVAWNGDTRPELQRRTTITT